MPKKIFLVILFVISEVSFAQSAKIEMGKLKSQLSEEINNYDYVDQALFNKYCCEKNEPTKLKYEILEEYNQIQKDIHACLKQKVTIAAPMTKYQKNFSTYARSINKELYDLSMNPDVSPGVRKDARAKLMKYIEKEDQKREIVYSRYKDRRSCVRSDYMKLYNTLKMKLDSNGGTAYRNVGRCLTTVGDLRFQCEPEEVAVTKKSDSQKPLVSPILEVKKEQPQVEAVEEPQVKTKKQKRIERRLERKKSKYLTDQYKN